MDSIDNEFRYCTQKKEKLREKYNSYLTKRRM